MGGVEEGDESTAKRTDVRIRNHSRQKSER
jgi:hypothetical protein